MPQQPNQPLNMGKYCYRIGGLVGNRFDCSRAISDDPQGLCKACKADQANSTVLNGTLVRKLIEKVRRL